MDGSKRAEKILPHVEDIAVHYKAKVFFLMVVENVFTAGIEGSFIQYSEKDFNAELEKAKSYLKNITENVHKKDISTQTVVASGPAVERIIQTAEKQNADIIAMASHGGGGLTRVFYGSVAAGVLNRADRPLLIVRSRQKG